MIEEISFHESLSIPEELHEEMHIWLNKEMAQAVGKRLIELNVIMAYMPSPGSEEDEIEITADPQDFDKILKITVELKD